MKKNRVKIFLVILFIGIVLQIGWLAVNASNLILRTRSQPAVLSSQDMNKEAQQYVKVCTKHGEQCYGAKLAALTRQKDFEYVTGLLSYIETLDPKIRGCHLVSHMVSSAEVQKDPKNWIKVLQEVDPNRCSGGFLHGVIEAHSLSEKNFKLDGSTIARLCEAVKAHTKGANAEFSCSHIMGHLLLVDTVGDIPKALNVCNEVREDLKLECLGGVFMENETRDNLAAHGILEHIPWNGETTSAQEEICLAQSGERATACWTELSHMYAYISKDTPATVYQSCMQAPNEKSQKGCYFHALGIMTSSSDFDEKNLGELCSVFNEQKEDYTACVTHVIISSISSSPKFADRVVNFCQAVNSTSRKVCYEELQRRLSNNSSNSIDKKICESIPTQYKIPGLCQ